MTNKYRIPFFKFDRGNKHVGFTIWYWRTKSDYGFYHSRCVCISWMRKIWKTNNVQPLWGYRDNGAKKLQGDKCLDANFGIGYLQINYVNWNLQSN